MTRDETKKILMIIQVSYPSYKPESMSFAIDLWCNMLKNYPFSIVSAALKNEISTNTTGFAPSIGKIIDEINKLKTKDKPILNANEAWIKVKFALRDGYYNSTDTFNELPTEIQQALGDASTLKHWSMIDSNYIDTHIRLEFIKSYQSILNEREKEDIVFFNQLNKNGESHEQEKILSSKQTED